MRSCKFGSLNATDECVTAFKMYNLCPINFENSKVFMKRVRIQMCNYNTISLYSRVFTSRPYFPTSQLNVSWFSKCSDPEGFEAIRISLGQNFMCFIRRRR